MEAKLRSDLHGKKVLFATVPADGHFNPLTGLAKYLQESMGCDVRWYTSVIQDEKLAKLGIPHYPFVHARDINGHNLEEVLPERRNISDPAAKLNFDMIHVFARRGPEYFKDIQEIHRSFPFDVMIADSLFTGIPFVSKKMHIPVVNIGIIPLPETSAYLAPYGTALHPPKSEEELAAYREMHKTMLTTVFKESVEEYTALLDHEGIVAEKAALCDVLIKQSDVYLQIGSPSFEYQRKDIGKNVHFIGALFPYVYQDQQNSWYDERLEKYKRVILVTQGTVERDVSKILEPTLEAFQHKDVLVLATTGGNGTKELRGKFTSSNLIIEDYLPFDTVMPMVDIYISNGGYGGTLLSIKHKLPMVVAGLHEGKSEICARVGYFECGIDLRTEYPQPIQILDAVNQLCQNGHYKNNVDRLAGELEEYPSHILSATHIVEILHQKEKENLTV